MFHLSCSILFDCLAYLVISYFWNWVNSTEIEDYKNKFDIASKKINNSFSVKFIFF